MGVATHYSVSLIKWSVISSLFSRVAIPSLHSCASHDPWHTQSYLYLPLITSDVRRKSKYTINHPRTHNDFRSRDSSISVVWEILMTNSHVVFSWADRSRTLFFNMFYVLWLITHILWLVKYGHLTEHMLVLVYCHSHSNNRLGTFRIVFFYASRFTIQITYLITQVESLFIDILSN